MKSGYLVCLNCLYVYTAIHIAVYMYIWPYANTTVTDDRQPLLRLTNPLSVVMKCYGNSLSGEGQGILSITHNLDSHIAVLSA